ncbi:putative MFS family arabinose efflux permease [Bradyrhizobium huanghuaihaiense]|uniref:Putative MFS family arabinose efflux permease n=1 Tax=Bradyrhizobium huanghuaihaiense TaxID=990078 RepID=A0A562RGX3_9BRAD|nr:MFS transporter [Bradyrhizobium huanghuaihaiense]TWI68349.1 putative MFS family arabinose efflux permease [Bradyrhizobium huanghuaihaiense]
MSSADRPATRLATRLAFLVAGFGMACWAPLVPFAKTRLGVDDGMLGLLLLSLGIGSVAAMLLTGIMSARYGSRPIIIAGGLGLALVLPLLAIASTPASLALALLAFGAALGSIDVAMNIHAVEVERAAKIPLMSGFHALFSIGGFAGSALMTALLSLRLGALACTLICSALMLAAMVVTSPRLLRSVQVQDGPLLVLPHGSVLLLALLGAITFLVEGAMLDWGALLVIGAGLVPEAQGGTGYIVFSIAMTVGRLGGDAVVARIGDRATLFWGSLIAIGGFVVLLTAPVAAVAMAGFLLIGLGASNLVPVLFRRAAWQTVMPTGLAVAAITTAGYAGILVGPAGVGFVARLGGLPMAFWLLAALMCLVTLSARIVTRPAD